MDTDNSPSRNPSSANGGTVEPANRAAVAKARFQTPADTPGERYELRDPFAEVTYRATTFAGMAAKADQLGSARFVAVAEDGERTTVRKVEGQWQRIPRPDPQHESQRQATPERPQSTAPARDDASDGTRDTPNVVPLPGATRSRAPSDPDPARTITTIDARAERTALVERVEAALMDRYIIKRAPVTVGDATLGRTEYRFRGDTSRVAFTESTFRLATDTNSPSVARSMVDVAEARQWKALRVSGNEDFKRLVWLEASVRGVKTLGYEPNPADLDVLKREREARQVNRIDREAAGAPGVAAAPADKASGRGSGGRKAVLAAIEAVLVAKRVPEAKRMAVMAAASEKLAQRIRDGQTPKVKVYDKTAPSQRPAVTPTPEVQRQRERAMPAPAR